MIIEKAYAKINLTMNVLSRRADGYHEIDSILCPLELHDELTFIHDAEIVLIEDHPVKDNVIIKTARLLQERFAIKEGARITVKKQIPVQAGLAGGSADSSATLRGLNRLWNLNLSENDMAKISADIGSDNPFCVYNRLARVKGRGEKLKFLAGDIASDILLIKPPYGASTKEIFSHHVIHQSGDCQNVLNAIANNDVSQLMSSVYNDLEETTMRLIPQLAELKKQISSMGFNVLMSGSGPTLFVIDNLPRLETIVKEISSKNITIFTKLRMK